MNSNNSFDIIENYLKGKLNQNEIQRFEAQTKQDTTLNADLEFIKDLRATSIISERETLKIKLEKLKREVSLDNKSTSVLKSLLLPLSIAASIILMFIWTFNSESIYLNQKAIDLAVDKLIVSTISDYQEFGFGKKRLEDSELAIEYLNKLRENKVEDYKNLRDSKVLLQLLSSIKEQDYYSSKIHLNKIDNKIKDEDKEFLNAIIEAKLENSYTALINISESEFHAYSIDAKNIINGNQ